MREKDKKKIIMLREGHRKRSGCNEYLSVVSGVLRAYCSLLCGQTAELLIPPDFVTKHHYYSIGRGEPVV